MSFSPGSQFTVLVKEITPTGQAFAQPIDSTQRGSIFVPYVIPEETVEVFYFGGATENILEYTYDEKSYPGGLPIVTFYKPNSKLEVIKKVYSNWLSRLL